MTERAARTQPAVWRRPTVHDTPSAPVQIGRSHRVPEHNERPITMTVRVSHGRVLSMTGAVAALLGGFAGDLAAQTAQTLTAQTAPAAETGWRFTVTPYAWLPSIEGNLRYALPPGSGDARSADVGMGAINLLEAINFAGMIAAEARYDRFVIMTDLIYLDMGNAGSRVDQVNLGGNAVSSTLDAGTDTSVQGTLWTLAGGYTLAQGEWGHVDAFAGFRLFSLSTSTNVRLSADVAGPNNALALSRNMRFSDSTTLFDGIVGARGRFLLGAGFHLPYAFDIGAGSSQLTWQAMAGIGYQTGWAGVTLGYRYLSYDQGNDKLVQDFSFSGPFLAVNFSF